MARKEEPKIGVVTVQPVRNLYARPRDIVAMYSISEPYLKKLRCLREGPPYRKLGRQVLYPLAEFSQWFERTAELVTADPSL